MLTRDQVKEKWIAIVSSYRRGASSIQMAWELVQWVEGRREECEAYLQLLGQVHAAISFNTEEEARASKYSLPPELAQSIYLALTQGVPPQGNEMDARLRKAGQDLLDYRKRTGPLNFQLEKADEFLREIRLALEGDAAKSSDVGN